MNRKTIGIVGWKTGNNSFGITLAYYSFLAQFGEVRILEPNGNVQDLDLLVLPGGPDLPQQWYKEPDKLFDLNVGTICPIRTFFADNILPLYIEKKTPIFGICLGHQMMAIKMADGILIPDMYHETSKEDVRNELVHTVLLGGNATIEVNSLHHQTVSKINTEKATVIARYNGGVSNKSKGISYPRDIEALAYTDYPAFSVQWHPEEIYDDFSTKLINKLLNP